MESHIPQGLKKPQNILLSLFCTYMALPRALPSSPPRGQGGGGGRPLCGASLSSTQSLNLHINVMCMHHIHMHMHHIDMHTHHIDMHTHHIDMHITLTCTHITLTHEHHIHPHDTRASCAWLRQHVHRLWANCLWQYYYVIIIKS